MATNGISGTAVFVLLAGSVLAWSGLKGNSVSSTVRQLLSGNRPVGPTSGSASISGVTGAAPTTGGGTAAQNKAIARLLTTPYGWSAGTEWDDLVLLWNRESSWSNTAMNASSGAYGIAQALPSTKYPLAGQPPSRGGSSSASAQIQWGLSYISGRYGSPSAAWAHEQANNWY